MAAEISKKYGDGSGNTVVWVDSSVQTNPHTHKPIVEVKISNAYDTLHANAKTDIRAVTIGDLVDAAVI